MSKAFEYELGRDLQTLSVVRTWVGEICCFVGRGVSIDLGRPAK